MSRFLRLYPAAWRERYDAEFLRVLQERPVRLSSSFDVILGAIDAHLHPELSGGAPHLWSHRLPGLMATAAGLIWSWYYLRILLAGPEDWGYGVFFAMLLMLFAVLGDYVASYARQVGLTIALVVATVLFAGLEPLKPIGDGMLNIAMGVAAAFLLSGGMLTLAALRAGIGAGVRWLLIASSLVVPAIVAIPVMGGFGPTDPGGAPAMVVAIMPYGIAWAIIGLRMTVRGSVTLHDAPRTEPTSEVAPA
jgi:hypothetical protein